MRKQWLAVVVFAMMVGCGGEPEETPELRAEKFVRAIYAQDAQKLWDSLSQETKVALAKKAGLSASDPRSAKEALLVGRARAWSTIKPLKEAEDRDPAVTEAKVTLETESGEKLVLELKKEADGWKVKLPTETRVPVSSPASTSQPQTAPLP
jgi:hypothetical protein